MKQLIGFAVLVAALAGSLPGSDCVTIRGGKIRAGDLAAAVPSFGAVDPALEVGYAPAPGSHRVLTAGQLTRLLRRHQSEAAVSEGVCVELETVSLDQQAVRKVMIDALGEPAAKVEIVEMSNRPVPIGRLEFRKNALQRPPRATPAAAVLWRGSVEYGERKSAPVWARVRVSVERRQVVAVRDLPAGREVSQGDLAVVTAEVFPDSEVALTDISEVAGCRLRRRIASGQPVPTSALIQPNAVERGEIVAVEVRSGGARVRFEAKAETSGRIGDAIYLRNPVSGKRFTATVEGEGKAVVATGAGRVSL